MPSKENYQVKIGNKRCPTCRFKIDMFTTNGNRNVIIPEIDYVVCIRCGEFLEFSNDFNLQKPDRKRMMIQLGLFPDLHREMLQSQTMARESIPVSTKSKPKRRDK